MLWSAVHNYLLILWTPFTGSDFIMLWPRCITTRNRFEDCNIFYSALTGSSDIFIEKHPKRVAYPHLRQRGWPPKDCYFFGAQQHLKKNNVTIKDGSRPKAVKNAARNAPEGAKPYPMAVLRKLCCREAFFLSSLRERLRQNLRFLESKKFTRMKNSTKNKIFTHRQIFYLWRAYALGGAAHRRQTKFA